MNRTDSKIDMQALDTITRKVLAYKPPPRSNTPKQSSPDRKRKQKSPQRKNRLAKA